jgi:hypothetical protein
MLAYQLERPRRLAVDQPFGEGQTHLGRRHRHAITCS